MQPDYSQTLSQGHAPLGATALPFVLGLTVGLTVAALIALYVTQAPVPFVDRGIQRPHSTPLGVPPPAVTGADSPRPAEPLATPFPKATVPSGKIEQPSLEDMSESKSAAPKPPLGREPSTAASASQFFLQVAAFKSSEEADQMRARLAFMGFEAHIVEAKRENIAFYRVRLGPYRNFEELNRAKTSLSENGLESTVVRSAQ